MPSRRQLEELLTADPDDVFLRYAVALAYASEGDADGAVTRLEQLAASQPGYVATYYQLARLRAESGDAAGARRALEAGIPIAQKAGDRHAAGEMAELLQQLAE